MGSNVASIISRNGDSGQGLSVRVSESAILSNRGGDSSGTDRQEIHGRDTSGYKGVGCEECRACDAGKNNVVLTSKEIRVSERRKGGNNTTRGWGLRDRRNVQVLRIPHHGADRSYTEKPINVVLRNIVGVERTYTQAMVTGSRHGNGVGGWSVRGIFSKQAIAAAIVGILVVRMCAFDFDNTDNKMEYLATLSFKELGQLRAKL